MKKVTLFAAMAALVFASCNKDENLQFEMSNHTITASMETDSPETRTAFDRTNGALYWIAGDDIAVLNTSGSFTKYTLTSGAGTANGTFTAKAKIGDNTTYALHPYSSHKYENSALTFNLPTTYTYADTEKGNEYGAAPMIAQTEETDASNFYFEHLGGAFCFTIKNLPATTTYFKFEADEQITGEFPVETNTETGKLEISLPNTQAASGTTYTVTINFPTEESATDKKFFIPLPVGTIEGFRISLGTSTEEIWSYTSTKSNTIARKKLLAMPEVTLNATVDGSVATEISTSEQLKAALANGGTYKLTTALTFNEQLTFNNVDKALTIDLGNNTLTLNTTSYGIVNKAGKLTIKNGTISSSNSYAALSNYYSSSNAANIETVLDNVNVTASNYAVYNKGVWEDGKTIQDYKDTDAAVKFTISGGSITSSTSATNDNWYAIYAVNYSHTTISGTTITGTNAAGGIGLNCAQATLTDVTINGGTTGTAHDAWIRTGILTTTNTTYDNYLYSASGDYGYTEVNGKFYGPTANQELTTVSDASSLSSALQNVTDGDIIILADDITSSFQLSFANKDKSATLYLNKNTLTLNTTSYGIVNKAGKLTIKNGTISSSNSYAALSNYYSSSNADNIETVLDNVNVTASNYAVYNKGVWEDGKTIQDYKDTDAAVKFTISGGSITSSTSATNDNWYAIYAVNYSYTTILGTTITGTNAAGGIGLNCAQATLTDVTINGGTAGTAHDAWIRTGILTTTNTTYDNYLYSASGDYGYTEVNGKFYGPTANQAYDSLEAVKNANSSSN